MATALHSARTRFFDKCGKPLCGGFVHTYQVGTTTAKPTYTDVSKTAVNTNPVILDSIGSAAIFLDGAYRVRVLDRNGVLVEDIAYIESWLAATEKDKIYQAIGDIDAVLNNHAANAQNPHKVTKSQLGLSNVDNTTDVDKPISNAVGVALLAKADKYDTYTKSETDNKISELTSTTYAGHKGYTTLALAQAAQASLPANTIIEVTNDSDSKKNGVYLWDGTVLTLSNLDPLGQAKTYTDIKTQNISTQSDAFIAAFTDKFGNAWGYVDGNGNLFLVNIADSVQANLNNLALKVNNIIINNDNLLDVKADKAGQVYSFTDKDGVEYRTNDIVINNKSVLGIEQSAYTSRVCATYQNALTTRYQAIKNLVPIATLAEDGLRNRMPSAIKISTGLLCFYHKQIVGGYDGDFQGSELWKAVINIDANLNVTIVSKELFLSPDQPKGVIKHPMLGRTSDNRIILMYEKRVETNENYTRYQMYSSDDGVSWTQPTQVNPSGINPAVNSALGTTGAIVTAKNNRLIVPMYTTGGTCYCIYSDDDGNTWTFSKWVDPAKVSGFEPSITFDMDDNLIMNIRPKNGTYKRFFAKSVDNGITWQPMTVSPDVPSSTTQGVIFRDKTIGAMLLSHAADTSANRIKFRVFVSYDNGKSYPLYYQPFNDNWYGGYSQIIKWVDGIYIIVLEYADSFSSTNTNENAGLIVLSIKEVLNNVSYS